MPQKPLHTFFEDHIEGTLEKAPVSESKIRICNLTNAVAESLGLGKGAFGVFITSRALKHLYDKKPAEEFHCLINGLDEIARYPSHIYKNKDSKRGDFCLVGSFNDMNYVCSVEIVLVPTTLNQEALPLPLESIEQEIQVVTAFRIRDNKYLKKYMLLWSREAGNPPS